MGNIYDEFSPVEKFADQVIDDSFIKPELTKLTLTIRREISHQVEYLTQSTIDTLLEIQ